MCFHKKKKKKKSFFSPFSEFKNSWSVTITRGRHYAFRCNIQRILDNIATVIEHGRVLSCDSPADRNIAVSGASWKINSVWGWLLITLYIFYLYHKTALWCFSLNWWRQKQPIMPDIYRELISVRTTDVKEGPVGCTRYSRWLLSQRTMPCVTCLLHSTDKSPKHHYPHVIT